MLRHPFFTFPYALPFYPLLPYAMFSLNNQALSFNKNVKNEDDKENDEKASVSILICLTQHERIMLQRLIKTLLEILF